jgi:hypothetical protein
MPIAKWSRPLPQPSFASVLLQLILMLVLTFGQQGCRSQQEPDADVDPVSKITMFDRLRLTLADADAAGIHLFDLKKLRADIVTLKQAEPELSDLLLADLDGIEALPKTEVQARVAIAKEMYGRFKIPAH